MRYVDAGYIVALSTLAVYAAGLVLRRRRLLRAAALSPPAPAPTPSVPLPDGTAAGGRARVGGVAEHAGVGTTRTQPPAGGSPGMSSSSVS